MANTSWFMQVGNLFSRALLRSPLHGMISHSVLLVEYRGRRSGRRYSTPVNYWQEGERVLIVSFRERTWWRNLRGGQPVTLRLRGKEQPGTAKIIEAPEQVAESLYRQVQAVPAYARYYGIQPSDQPLASTNLLPAAQTRVIVQVDLTPSP